jgi:hypothetical protein
MNIQPVKVPSMISTCVVAGTTGAATASAADANLSEFAKKGFVSLPQRSKTVTRKSVKSVNANGGGYSSASDQSITDLYDKLDQISVSSDEFYANLLSMSDDSLELGSIDGDDGDVIIQGTEMITSSFFYNTGRRMNTEKRRRGKKKSKNITEFNKGVKGVASTSTTTNPNDDPATVTINGVVPEQIVGTVIDTSEDVQSEQQQLEQQEPLVDELVAAVPIVIATENFETIDNVNKKKGIRFVVDEIDNIIPEIFYIDRIEHEYHSDVYYDDIEHNTMKIDAYFFAEDYMIDNCSGMTYISQIVDDSLNCPFNFTGWNKHINSYNFQSVLFKWCNDTGRGLESFVTPALQMSSTSTVQSILAYQNRLVSTVSSSNASSSARTTPITKSERRYLLAQESIRRTEGSIRLAHVLAIGDQLVVQQYDDEDKEIVLRQQKHDQQLAAATKKKESSSSTTTSRINSSILMKPSYWISKFSGGGGNNGGNNSSS